MPPIRSQNASLLVCRVRGILCAASRPRGLFSMGCSWRGGFVVGLEREGAGSGAPRPLGLLPHCGEQKQLCAPVRGPDGAAVPPLLCVRPCHPGKNHSRRGFRHGDGWIRDEEGPGRLLIRRLPREPSAVPSRGWDAQFFQPNPLQQRSSAASPA